MKIGLVFSGGGAKGSYQVGVWKAMQESGLERQVKVVAGSSVGGLNGFMFACSDCATAERFWRTKVNPSMLFSAGKQDIGLLTKELALASMAPQRLRFNPIRDLARLLKQEPILEALGMLAKTLAGNAAFSQAGIGALIDEVFEDNLRAKDIELYVAAYQFMYDRTAYFRMRKQEPAFQKKVLLASAAIPVIFHPVKIGRIHYHDGGCQDNIPISPIAKEDCDIVIIVNIEGCQTAVDFQDLYPQTGIIEIKPSKNLGGMTSILNFSPKEIEANLDLGYSDGIQAFRILQNEMQNQESLLLAAKETNQRLAQSREPYPAPDLRPERISSKLKDFYLKTGSGINLKLPIIKDLLWETVDSANGWKLQRRKKSIFYRVLDPEGEQTSLGTEIAQNFHFCENAGIDPEWLELD